MMEKPTLVTVNARGPTIVMMVVVMPAWGLLRLVRRFPAPSSLGLRSWLFLSLGLLAFVLLVLVSPSFFSGVSSIVGIAGDPPEEGEKVFRLL